MPKPHFVLFFIMGQAPSSDAATKKAMDAEALNDQVRFVVGRGPLGMDAAADRRLLSVQMQQFKAAHGSYLPKKK